MNLEHRVEQLERQMEQRIARNNLFADLLDTQLQTQLAILDLLMQSVPTHLSFPLLEQLLAQQQQKLQTLFQTLSEDDEQGRQYIQQMIDSVAQAQHCRQLAQQVVDTHR